MTVASDSVRFAPPAEPSLAMGVIGNCAFSALIDARGRIVWCCLPRFDGDPVFNALIEPGTGNNDGDISPSSAQSSAFGIEIEDFSESKQWYEPNTAVLRTQLFDKSGQGIEITDFAPRFFSHSRFFKPMTLVRRVRPIHGAPRIRVSLDLRFDWGRRQPLITQGSNHLRYVGDALTLRL
ncbi:MAG TPA: glucoamylase, partial [Polaromonas sp.]|nr:glucoamylase [Polaromonas sp.]